METKKRRAVILYIRDFTPASSGETEYVKKHNGLIRLIDEIMQTGKGDTIEVTSQISLGDNESEFRESLRRIQGAELYLQIGRVTYHPVDLPMLKWKGKR
jgi:hypothetical protein